jgi:hypothetical protein
MRVIFRKGIFRGIIYVVGFVSRGGEGGEGGGGRGRRLLLLSPVIPSDRRESRNLLSESRLPLQAELRMNSQPDTGNALKRVAAFF